MAASIFDCHISADIDAKKSSMTKSSFGSGNIKTRQVISARITCIKPIQLIICILWYTW